MDTLTRRPAFDVLPDVFVLPAWCPVKGLGLLPMNSFLIRGREPVLVDTGPRDLSDELVRQVEQLVDLDDLRWIWLTHTDPDHLGGLAALLERAPNVRVATTFLGAGKLALHSGLPQERVHLVEPGETLDVGDRELRALRPPVYDAPETIAAFDTRTRTLFSADCFGALMTEPVPSTGDLSAEALFRGMLTWVGIDAPWLELVEPFRFGRTLRAVEHLAPAHVLGAHLPPAHGMAEELLGHLARAAGVPDSRTADVGAVEVGEAHA